MLTGRPAIAAGDGAATQYLHPKIAPRPPSGMVPILDLIDPRNRGLPAVSCTVVAGWLATGSLLRVATKIPILPVP